MSEQASWTLQELKNDLLDSEERVGMLEMRASFDDPVEVEQMVLSQMQIKAILLIAEQLERIADTLEGSNDLAFSVALWNEDGEK